MQNTSIQHSSGYVYAIIAGILFGASTPAAKYLLGAISPWLLAGLLYLGSGLGLSIVLIMRHFIIKKSSEANLTYHDYGWLVGATIFGGIMGPVLLMMGLVQMNAATASLLLNLESIFTALVAWIIFKEHTHKRLVLGMFLIIAGGVVLAWQNYVEFNNGIGFIFIAGACFAWAIDNNITRKISAADPLKIVAIKSFVAGSTNIILAVIFGATLSNKLGALSTSAVIGFIGYGLSLICFILALRHIGTARTSACFSLAPFVGAGISILFLGETLSVQLIMAGILMGWGIWLHLTESHIHEHQHNLLIHTHKHYHDEHHQHEHLPTDLTGEPHSHLHVHTPLLHNHPHYPDIHHQHCHGNKVKNS